MSAEHAACRECPYRVGSPYGYDADALEALRNDMEPSCHMVVGRDAIFHHEPPSRKQRCRGHDAWMCDMPGFAEPRLTT